MPKTLNHILKPKKKKSQIQGVIYVTKNLNFIEYELILSDKKIIKERDGVFSSY